MATISITIPDASVPRVLEAALAKYPTELEGLTGLARARKIVALLVQEMVYEHEVSVRGNVLADTMTEKLLLEQAAIRAQVKADVETIL